MDERKQEMLSQSHMCELVAFVERLRRCYPSSNFFVPDFDPEDGGVNAKMLLLLKKPSVKTVPKKGGKGGTGFVSQDNGDDHANATKALLEKLGIDRKKIIIWNAISAYNGEKKITAQDRKDAIEKLKELLSILPMVKSVVLVGGEAKKMEKEIEEKTKLKKCQIFKSYDPSPKGMNLYLDGWKEIPDVWRKAYEAIKE